MTTTLLFCALAVSAPAAKDPPRKEPTIVGEWLFESGTSDGKPEKPPPGLRYEFTADGRLIARADGERPQVCYYKVDPKADPPTIDVGDTADALVRPGLIKLDGDRLLWCSSWDDKRPKALEAPTGSRQSLVVLKRVRQKD